MNPEKESIEIDIEEGGSACKARSEKIWVDDEGFNMAWDLTDEEATSNRVKFSLKVGLAVLLVSVLVLIRAPSDVFGTNIVWSILTVAVMFEYTVGATFNRGFNRALGSLLAGILAIGVGQIALRAGRNVEPILIGVSIFLIGVITSFMKLWPSMEPYEHGLRVVLFTYCVIVVSGYRMGNPIQTAMERLYSIAIGGFVASLVNVLVFPIWAGEQLHMELIDGFNAVAESLEECVKKYLEDEQIDHAEFCKAVTEEFPDEMAYKKCKATLSSSAKLQSLADSAKWEPPHDRFKNYFYPWSDYIQVGAVLRHCAYGVMALHCVLHSEIQAPHALRTAFETEMQEATSHATELIRTLVDDINNMKTRDKTSLLKSTHSSMERLQTAINIHWNGLMARPLDNSPRSVARQSNSKLKEMDTSKPPEGRETYRERMRKQSRRVRIKECEAIGAMSVTSFITMLLEFLARLDHLVEAVDELSRSAKFKQETAW